MFKELSWYFCGLFFLVNAVACKSTAQLTQEKAIKKNGVIQIRIDGSIPSPYNAALNSFAERVSSTLEKQRVTLTIDVLADSTEEEGQAFKQKSDWYIEVGGGFIRNPRSNPDVFMLVLCHELGHLLGGQPTRYLSQFENATSGANNGRSTDIATEGQADYYATQRCMKIVLEEHYMPPTEARIVNAGFNLLSIINAGPISLNGKDSTIVAGTLLAAGRKPSPQCRLDTFIAGARCEKKPNLVGNFKDPFDGTCRTGKGARPTCWFNPKIN